jgi:hypothetical protein
MVNPALNKYTSYVHIPNLQVMPRALSVEVLYLAGEAVLEVVSTTRLEQRIFVDIFISTHYASMTLFYYSLGTYQISDLQARQIRTHI